MFSAASLFIHLIISFSLFQSLLILLIPTIFPNLYHSRCLRILYSLSAFPSYQPSFSLLLSFIYIKVFSFMLIIFTFLTISFCPCCSLLLKLTFWFAANFWRFFALLLFFLYSSYINYPISLIPLFLISIKKLF